MNRVEQQLAFILKSQRFKETSFIHQVFTKDYGVVSLISRGSKSKASKTGSILQPFRQLMVSWAGKSDLKTLTSSEQFGEINMLKGTGLYCGFYVNELVLSLLHKFDSHPILFEAFRKVIGLLASDQSHQVYLREFEKILLQEIGYGLQLEYEADTQLKLNPALDYTYIIGKGAVMANVHSTGQLVSGATLINLNNNCLGSKTEFMQAKKLMRRLIDHQLDGKILKIRELFS
ncbi:MAG: DNA repair protein RecO [Piscirickettsiaceae bacterium]|nr:MAG: DNA repair protein RecO [Piscirickettsiaceae bacterium]